MEKKMRENRFLFRFFILSPLSSGNVPQNGHHSPNKVNPPLFPV